MLSGLVWFWSEVFFNPHPDKVLFVYFFIHSFFFKKEDGKDVESLEEPPILDL